MFRLLSVTISGFHGVADRSRRARKSPHPPHESHEEGPEEQRRAEDRCVAGDIADDRQLRFRASRADQAGHSGRRIPRARAVERAHAAGVVHGDLKPANLLTVLTNGQISDVKITDFGSVLNVRMLAS